MAKKNKTDDTSTVAPVPPEANASIVAPTSPATGRRSRTPVVPEPEVGEFDLPDSKFDPALDGLLPVPKAEQDPGDEQPVEPEEKPIPVPVHPAYLLRLARDVGISDEEIQSYSSADLKDYVHLLRQEYILAQQRQPKPDEKPTQAESDEFDLDPEAYDPKLVKGFAKAKAIEKQNAELQKRLEAVEQREQSREFQIVEQRIENCFATLGEQYHGVFGKGALAEVGPTEAQRRNALVRAVGIHPGDPRFSSAFKSTVQSLYGSVLKTETPKPTNRLTDRQQTWQNGTTHKPTNRQETPAKGPDSATRAVAQKLRDLGVEGDDYEIEDPEMPE